MDRGRSPRRNTQTTPLPVNLVQQEEEPCVTTTTTAVQSSTTTNSNTCPNTPSGTQAGLCYSPTCRSRCSSPCPGSPCPGSPCGSITPPPPPPHPLTSSQQYLHQHSNKNCPAAQQVFTAQDYPSRRQSLDRLDSPQVWTFSKVLPFVPRSRFYTYLEKNVENLPLFNDEEIHPECICLEERSHEIMGIFHQKICDCVFLEFFVHRQLSLVLMVI